MLETHDSPDPGQTLERVGPFLRAEPVRRNQFLTALDRMITTPEPSGGRCWWTTEGDTIIGLALHAANWPRVLLSATSDRAVEALAAVIHATTPDLAGVSGEAWAAARFAGTWTDLAGGAAEPIEGERLYELSELSAPSGIAGSARKATVDDVPTLADWHVGFCTDIGVEPWPNPQETMAGRVAERGVWVWEHDRLVAMANTTQAIAGASRISHVYTLPAERGRGYGAAVTAAATGARLAEGVERCLLYTQLANGTSNHIYRRLGYSAIEERLVYRLTSGSGRSVRGRVTVSRSSQTRSSPR